MVWSWRTADLDRKVRLVAPRRGKPGSVSPAQSWDNLTIYGEMRLRNEIVIALGANDGSPRESLDQALHLMDESGILIRKCSRIYRTRPWGMAEQPVFLNAAVLARSRQRPLSLLAILLMIERKMGRRRVCRWGPRRIDLDLILYGTARMNHRDLHLPHPEIFRRDFVLAPLMDLGLPAVPGVAPFGWRRFLNFLPHESRTILSSRPWK